MYIYQSHLNGYYFYEEKIENKDLTWGTDEDYLIGKAFNRAAAFTLLSEYLDLKTPEDMINLLIDLNPDLLKYYPDEKNAHLHFNLYTGNCHLTDENDCPFVLECAIPTYAVGYGKAIIGYFFENATSDNIQVKQNKNDFFFSYNDGEITAFKPDVQYFDNVINKTMKWSSKEEIKH